MARKKLQRFAQLGKFDNVVQCQQFRAASLFKKMLDKNRRLILELGCGKGDYSLALAKMYFGSQIVGIDIQGERLWYGALRAKQNKISNVIWLRIAAEDLLKYFHRHSVAEIWITFPDPYPKKSQIKKRLTSSNFLQIYKKILKPNGLIHLKTDDIDLFNYSLDSIKKVGGKILELITDIYQKEKLDKMLKIQTDFEKKHLKSGKTINYIKCSL